MFTAPEVTSASPSTGRYSSLTTPGCPDREHRSVPRFCRCDRKAKALTRIRVLRFQISGDWSRFSFPSPCTRHFRWNSGIRHPVFRYSYQSLVTPSSVFDYNTGHPQQTLLKQQEVPAATIPSSTSRSGCGPRRATVSNAALDRLQERLQAGRQGPFYFMATVLMASVCPRRFRPRD